MAAADTFRRVMMALYDERIATEMRPGFLSSFFGKDPSERSVSESEKVEMDIIRDDRLIAVDVTRGTGFSQINMTGKWTAKEYTPPLYSEEGAISASMLNKRLPGVDPYTDSGRMAAFLYHAQTYMREMAKKIERELERQASEALQLGTVTLKNTTSLDFHRKSEHSITPSTKWNNAGAPITDIRGHCDTIFHDGKMKPDTLIFGPLAWDAFINNTSVRTYLDTRWIEPGKIQPGEVVEGATLQGRVSIGDYQLTLYTYPEFYTNAAGTANTLYVTTDSVIIMARTAKLAKAFAATEVLPWVEDEYRRQGLPALPALQIGEFVPFTYLKPPTSQMVGVQSAPLIIPTAIDTFGVIINVDT